MTPAPRDPGWRCAVAVMAKAPQPGQVKTRLVPPLTPDAATALNAAFLRDMTENVARAAAVAAVDAFVAYAPADGAALFDGLLAPGTRLLLADGADGAAAGVTGIGRSLLHAARSLLAAGYAAVCMVNADSPTLPTAYLHQAIRHLAGPGERVVLGPAEDGGYYLLGLTVPHAALFADMPWSTAGVAATTMLRASELGLTVDRLPPWYDVDDAASLRRLAAELAVPPAAATPRYAAPATTACLRRLGLMSQAVMS